MKIQPEPKVSRKPWHDAAELRDRLNQPKVTLAGARAQFQRTMSQPPGATRARPTKKPA